MILVAVDRVVARAGARLARVVPRARIPVVACGAVGLRGIGADTRRRVANPRLVALIGGAADDRLAARAGARLARVVPRARIPVVACGAVGLRGIGADTRRRVADARLVALIGGAADDRLAARAGARLARVVPRARIPVVARSALGLRGIGANTDRRIADARLMALVGAAADDGGAARAGAFLARINLRAGVPVVARGTV